MPYLGDREEAHLHVPERDRVERAGEEDHLELPRLVFEHTRRNFGLVRIMIDRINSFAQVSPMQALAAQAHGHPGDRGQRETASEPSRRLRVIDSLTPPGSAANAGLR